MSNSKDGRGASEWLREKTKNTDSKRIERERGVWVVVKGRLCFPHRIVGMKTTNNTFNWCFCARRWRCVCIYNSSSEGRLTTAAALRMLLRLFWST